jgi:hypothetical protein
MTPPVARPPRFAHRLRLVILACLFAWFACGFWNFVKPLPFGTRVTSLPARLAESQVDFIEGDLPQRTTRQRALVMIDNAEQMIVMDQCPLGSELTTHLLTRKRQRPNLKVVLVTDPRNEVYGGTPARTLETLEASGIIVARVRLDRLRDSNPLYSSLWRLGVAWWDDPFNESPGEVTLRSTLRRLNFKFDRRQLLVADNGAGGWTSLLGSANAVMGGIGLEVRGQLAREIAGSELQIAAWSTDDDRLPAPPPLESHGVGTIDARFLTESAIRTGLRDVMAGAAAGDSIDLDVKAMGERRIVTALLQATARGAHVRLLLDPAVPANSAVAAELERKGAGSVEVRWRAAQSAGARYVLVRRGNDLWLNLGSADLTRRSLNDFNLEANLELRMPARAAAAHAAADAFAREWSRARAYTTHVDESTGTYWRYRIADLTGLVLF